MNPAVNKATKGLGGSFKGVALYLITPKEPAPGEPTPERTGFIITQNLPTDDAGRAWRIMARTAQDREALKAAAGVSAAGRKSKDVKAVFHYALSWHPDQKPTPEQMQEAARSSLRALKLEAHQALIVQHVDEDRAHLHIVVNRVHPETGKLDPLSNNIRRLDRWANDYEKASGEIVSRDRAAKYEALDNGQKPEPRQKKASKPRKEWEAEQPPKAERKAAPQRSAAHAERLDRYKQAAQTVREQFKPEWAAHYRTQRQQERMLQKQQRTTLAALKQAQQLRRTPTPQPFGKIGRALGLGKQDSLTAFYNRHRELIWQGIPEGQRPTDSRAIVNAPAMRRAIENAHAKQRDQLAAAQTVAKKELQARHDAARQTAQRAAWQQPGRTAPAKPIANDTPHQQPPQGITWGQAAAALGAIGLAAVAARGKSKSDPAPEKAPSDPARDFEAAAERIRRQQHRQPANESRAPAPEPQRPEVDRDELAAHRSRADEAAERIRAARARNASRKRDPNRYRDREPGPD